MNENEIFKKKSKQYLKNIVIAKKVDVLRARFKKIENALYEAETALRHGNNKIAELNGLLSYSDEGSN